LLLGFDPWLVGGIDIHGNLQISRVLFNQRLHTLPIQSAHAGRKFWQSYTAELFGLNRFPKRFQAMIHIFNRSIPGLAPMTRWSFLSEEADNPDIPDTRQTP
jgi:hypothetical protein